MKEMKEIFLVWSPSRMVIFDYFDEAVKYFTEKSKKEKVVVIKIEHNERERDWLEGIEKYISVSLIDKARLWERAYEIETGRAESLHPSQGENLAK